MTETKILDKTLEIIEQSGTLKAYDYLLTNLSKEQEWSSQVYNFLYCLAATSGKPGEALSWIEEAVNEKNLWYRPEVFEDSDLDTIRNDQRFTKCEEISQHRYEKALANASAVCTWTEKSGDNLIIVLHGNQQNNMISSGFWSGLNLPGYQIEYLQSKEVDSYNLFRWNDDGDGPKQLAYAVNNIDYYTYRSRILAGFSAGCNTILKTIITEGVRADRLILVAPWMPAVENSIDSIITSLKKSGIRVLIICGKNDEDCLPHCRIFSEKAEELQFEYDLRYIEGLGHGYPEEFVSLISTYLN